MRFTRTEERGKLFVDEMQVGKGTSFGNTNQIEVEPEFYLGGISQELRENDFVSKNVYVSYPALINPHNVLGQKRPGTRYHTVYTVVQRCGISLINYYSAKNRVRSNKSHLGSCSSGFLEEH